MRVRIHTTKASVGNYSPQRERESVAKEKINIIAAVTAVEGPEREGITRSRSNGHRNGKITVAYAMEERRMREDRTRK